MLKAKQRSAAGALFGLALNQAQIHQLQTSGMSLENEGKSSTCSNSSSSSHSSSEGARLWVNESSDLLRPVFRALEIDDKEWPRLEETARSSSANHNIGELLKILSEEGGDTSAEPKEKELTLAKAIDDMASSIKTSPADFEGKKEKRREYEQECKKKFYALELESDSEEANKNLEEICHQDSSSKSATIVKAPIKVDEKPKLNEKPKVNEKPLEEVKMLGYQRKVSVLYELLSACLADKTEDDKKSTQRRKGYDARHRLALRLLATWLNLEWIKMEAIETTVALSAMALLEKEESKDEKTESSEGTWAKWKRGGIIGAAAITGGTIMAISGGLAAPAIAAGFGALAPALGVLPVLGGGFAAVATAAGSVAGSAAVAASFGAAGAGLSGTKMARRTGDVDEFEFKVIGENHNKGRLAVEIMISGFVFKEEDFIRPWEGHDINLESYALQWESRHLIAVSNALQDWITSKFKTELMKQGAMLTVFSTLVTAVAWPSALLTVTNLIDSKWAMAIDRSDKAGKLLAEVLMKGLQGHRPVTLVGFSLGARVIFKCLQELAENKLNGAGLVERVVLLGAPIPILDENWEATRQVVAGRFVNAYSMSDWMLGLAFRASLLTQGLAGIQPIDVPGIQNVNVTELVEGHSSYLWASQYILDQLDLDNYNPVFTPTPIAKS